MQLLNREIKNKIAQFKSNKWHETLTKAKTNDNSIWKLAKTFSKRKQTIPPLIANCMEANTNEQKAEAPVERFHNVYKTDDTNATQEQTNIKNEVNKLIHTISESDEHYFFFFFNLPFPFFAIRLFTVPFGRLSFPYQFPCSFAFSGDATGLRGTFPGHPRPFHLTFTDIHNNIYTPMGAFSRRDSNPC
jgi:hypothetical protein